MRGARGLSSIPDPHRLGENFAGLFTVDLPPGVIAGQEFTITVRRVATRRSAAPPPPPAFGGEPATATDEVEDPHRQLMRNWRYIVGTFAVRIPVATADTILPLEEDALAIMKWRLGQMTPPNRWIAVLKRYIDQIAGRVNGLGGQAGTIEPSPWGARGFAAARAPARSRSNREDQWNRLRPVRRLRGVHAPDRSRT